MEADSGQGCHFGRLSAVGLLRLWPKLNFRAKFWHFSKIFVLKTCLRASLDDKKVFFLFLPRLSRLGNSDLCSAHPNPAPVSQFLTQRGRKKSVSSLVRLFLVNPSSSLVSGSKVRRRRRKILVEFPFFFSLHLSGRGKRPQRNRDDEKDGGGESAGC